MCLLPAVLGGGWADFVVLRCHSGLLNRRVRTNQKKREEKKSDLRDTSHFGGHVCLYSEAPEDLGRFMCTLATRPARTGAHANTS